ncbi:MAG: uracil-DNA glycosylase [Sphaerochaetaceae bacterium]|jgi:DNA polymerase|nr:uracil-DNA glycosylase [Sphaerochaetaceae bacterium]MDD2404965.1 uracil-DNA glycosylase [Sphaerochaetaceae bacterium]MDD3671044.1 uracil-DNA glycosylase [Sphaerochaetaceae bacterium]MDD4258296.1 uracil-DNA glycosylase [Sphaerochaetaceae bacterium]MDD4762419.1 uracil-DNA glycosylase [Sphaerochaetaceae bacterium]
MINDKPVMTAEELEQKLQELWVLEEDLKSYVLDEPARQVPTMTSVVEKLSPLTFINKDDEIISCSLSQLELKVAGCTRCKLATTRRNAVVGEGVVPAEVMVIGEGPGADEDATGKPFVGKAGQYLDRWLASISLSRDKNVYIANIVKCRPPGNRDPESDEVSSCMPYLKRQIELIRPHAILCLGRIAAHNLLGNTDTLHQLRNRWFRYESVPLIVTYHPSAVLRNQSLRAPVWEDLKRLANLLHIELPGKAR